jgi:hypothetical protein
VTETQQKKALTMMKSLALAGALLCALTINAEARQRHRVIVADPGCNVIFPCEGVISSPRGERIVKAMHGFGSAQKIYAPRRPVSSYGAPSPGNGVVRSVSGATAHVAAGATAAFQCLVSALDRQGYPIRFMGGWRAHGSVPGSLHPAGLALDINQLSRNVTRPAMPGNQIALANACGLVSGAQWNWADSGHFQLGGWAGNGRHYAHRSRHHRYASAR